MCKLRRSIYGLKQSVRCCNRALHEVLVKAGFTQFRSDSCLYVRRDCKNTIYLLVYVDDFLVGCRDEGAIATVFDALCKDFDITNLGPVRHFFSYEVRRYS